MNIAVLSDIHGNHAAFEACLDYLKNEEIDAFILLGDSYPSTVGMIRYAARHTRAEDLAYFETLQRTLRIEFPQLPTLRICHGSPRAIKEDIKPQNAVNQEIFEQIEETYIVCGHTHRVTDIEEYGKIVWNPGAVVHSLF